MDFNISKTSLHITLSHTLLLHPPNLEWLVKATPFKHTLAPTPTTSTCPPLFSHPLPFTLDHSPPHELRTLHIPSHLRGRLLRGTKDVGLPLLALHLVHRRSPQPGQGDQPRAAWTGEDRGPGLPKFEDRSAFRR